MSSPNSLDPSIDWDGLERNRIRPEGKPAMLQTWHDLVFLHSAVPVSVLRQLVPKHFEVETYGGEGWLGFVPFRMSRVRPARFFGVPWLSNFHETNLRTYVTHPKHGPGVWFFSLEAARYLACLVARRSFSLPYFHGQLSSRISDLEWHYEGSRKERQLLPSLDIEAAGLIDYSVTIEREGDWFHAEPRTFEYWLTERYRLYALGANDQPFTASVHHQPYTLSHAKILDLQVAGLEKQFQQLSFTNVLAAMTLNVECFSPLRI